MAIFTLTTNARVNLAPNRIGNLNLSLDYNQLYVFTLADFTTNTIPTYQDPEGDDLENVKIITLPSVGEITLSGTPINALDEISSSDINSGLLKYQCDNTDLDGYIDTDTTFDISDEGSSTYSGLTPGVITFNVEAQENLPPSEVGDNSLTTDYGETIIFTVADFTTGTTPAYADPEGDNADLLKILTLPGAGNLYYNGSPVVLNQIITFNDIALGLLTYIPNLADTDGDVQTFNFSIADAGSGIFVE